MENITQVLKAIGQGDPRAADALLPLVYEELRRLAKTRLAREPQGLTLQATDLVHEAYLRLIDVDQLQDWNSRGHFFAAAAQAMRRILIENARRRSTLKHGGHLQRVGVDLDDIASLSREDDELLALDAALKKFAETNPRKAKLVELRFFASLTVPQAAQVLDISLSTAARDWVYARAWLYKTMADKTLT
ncbi:MAG: sigma-70 family RNA polymerase sigma factor [bacterium]|nr:sigma-70 family RNA polymerase sigma factor [bacterium]